MHRECAIRPSCQQSLHYAARLPSIPPKHHRSLLWAAAAAWTLTCSALLRPGMAAALCGEHTAQLLWGAGLQTAACSQTTTVLRCRRYAAPAAFHPARLPLFCTLWLPAFHIVLFTSLRHEFAIHLPHTLSPAGTSGWHPPLRHTSGSATRPRCLRRAVVQQPPMWQRGRSWRRSL